MIRGTLPAVAALVALTGCGNSGDDAPSRSRGEQLFVERCGSCHTLRAAETEGTALDLDYDLREVDEARVLESITSPPTGMPKDLAQGADAEAIAEFVAQNRTPREQ